LLERRRRRDEPAVATVGDEVDRARPLARVNTSMPSPSGFQ
jgi:hypothetical protein